MSVFLEHSAFLLEYSGFTGLVFLESESGHVGPHWTQLLRYVPALTFYRTHKKVRILGDSGSIARQPETLNPSPAAYYPVAGFVLSTRCTYKASNRTVRILLTVTLFFSISASASDYALVALFCLMT